MDVKQAVFVTVVAVAASLTTHLLHSGGTLFAATSKPVQTAPAAASGWGQQVSGAEQAVLAPPTNLPLSFEPGSYDLAQLEADGHVLLRDVLSRREVLEL
eukprot:gene21117-29097_t